MANKPWEYVNLESTPNPLTGPLDLHFTHADYEMFILSWESLRLAILFGLSKEGHESNDRGLRDYLLANDLYELLEAHCVGNTNSQDFIMLGPDNSVDFRNEAGISSRVVPGYRDTSFFDVTLAGIEYDSSSDFLYRSTLEISSGYIYYSMHGFTNLGYHNPFALISGSNLKSEGIIQYSIMDSFRSGETIHWTTTNFSGSKFEFAPIYYRAPRIPGNVGCFKSIDHLSDWLFGSPDPGPGPGPGDNSFGFDYPEPGEETIYRNWTTPPLNRRVIFQNYSFAVPNFRLIKGEKK